MKRIKLLCALKLINDLIESSSSSDEDDEMFAMVCNEEQRKKENIRKNKQSSTKLNDSTNNQKKGNIFENEKINSLSANSELNAVLDDNIKQEPESFENPFMNSLSETDFKTKFHVSRETAIYLMEQYSLWYGKSHFNESTQKSTVETNILSFLWFSANEVNLEDVAQVFKTTWLAIYQSFNSVLKFLVDVLAPDVIKLPSTYIEKEAVAKDFEQIAGFPNVLGCVADSFLTVKFPKQIQQCGGSCIYLRGICDSKRRFLNVKTGITKEINDSFLEKDLPKLCFPKYHLLGDLKCPIRENLIIPYENNGVLSDSEKNFNTKFERTHVKIRNAFGILKSRFHQLKYFHFDNVEVMFEYIIACCVIHNICINREDVLSGEIYTDVSDRLSTSSLTSVKTNEFFSDLGLMKRYELKELLFRTKT